MERFEASAHGVFGTIRMKVILWCMCWFVVGCTGTDDGFWTSLPAVDNSGSVYITGKQKGRSELHRFELGGTLRTRALTQVAPGLNATCIMPVDSNDGFVIYSSQPVPNFSYMRGGLPLAEARLSEQFKNYAIFPQSKTCVGISPESYGFGGHERISVFKLHSEGAKQVFTESTIQPDYAAGAWHIGSVFTSSPMANWFALTTQDGRPHVWVVDETGVTPKTFSIESPMDEQRTGLVWTDIDREISKVLVAKNVEQPDGRYTFEISVWSTQTGVLLFRQEPIAVGIPYAAALVEENSLVYCTKNDLMVVNLLTKAETRIKRNNLGFIPTRVISISPSIFLLVEEVNGQFRVAVEGVQTATQLTAGK